MVDSRSDVIFNFTGNRSKLLNDSSTCNLLRVYASKLPWSDLGVGLVWSFRVMEVPLTDTHVVFQYVCLVV